MGVGTFQAVARDDGIDEPRVRLAQGGLVQAVLPERHRPGVGEEHVGGLGELGQRIATGRFGNVQHDPALAAVVELKGWVRADVVLQVGEDVAHGVAFAALDLDHVRAPIPQDCRRAGSGDVGSEIDDRQALEQHVASIPVV